MVAMAPPQLAWVQMWVCNPQPVWWISSSEPQIKRHPTNLTLLLEAKAVLPCVTLGNPKPDVTWLKDDELVKVGASISAPLEDRRPSQRCLAAPRSATASPFWTTEP